MLAELEGKDNSPRPTAEFDKELSKLKDKETKAKQKELDEKAKASGKKARAKGTGRGRTKDPLTVLRRLDSTANTMIDLFGDSASAFDSLNDISLYVFSFGYNISSYSISPAITSSSSSLTDIS
jgi:hypothetical protein